MFASSNDHQLQCISHLAYNDDIQIVFILNIFSYMQYDRIHKTLTDLINIVILLQVSSSLL